MTLAALAMAAVLLSAAQDGHWSGWLDGGPKAAKLSFQVTHDGRRLERFRTTVSAFCVGPSIETNRIAILVVHVPRARVRRDGRFSADYRPNGEDGGEYRISGTLRGTRVRNGRVQVNVSTCGGREEWTARRTRR